MQIKRADTLKIHRTRLYEYYIFNEAEKDVHLQKRR